MTQLAKVFEIKRQRFSLRTGVVTFVVLALPLIVLAAIGQEKYWLSMSFGAWLVLRSDRGGDYMDRAARITEFAAIGALLTGSGAAEPDVGRTSAGREGRNRR